MSTQITPESTTQPIQTSKFGRRALLVTAGVGVCAAGAAATPFLVDEMGKLGKGAADAALQAGIEQGRQEILRELAALEGVAIDDAIAIAELTKSGVKGLVVPVAQLASIIGSGAISILSGAVKNAQDTLAHFGQQVQWLDQIHTMLETWKAYVILEPALLNDVTVKDINQAETYLKALQAKIKADASATPTPKQ